MISMETITYYLLQIKKGENRWQKVVTSNDPVSLYRSVSHQNQSSDSVRIKKAIAKKGAFFFDANTYSYRIVMMDSKTEQAKLL